MNFQKKLCNQFGLKEQVFCGNYSYGFHYENKKKLAGHFRKGEETEFLCRVNDGWQWTGDTIEAYDFGGRKKELNEALDSLDMDAAERDNVAFVSFLLRVET